jgi:deoxyribodipyrimidine photo-lyase
VQLANGAGVVAVFVLDEFLLARSGPSRATYLQRTLESLNNDLGGKLTVRRGTPVAALGKLIRETGAKQVVATADHAPYGQLRDSEVARALNEMRVEFSLIDSNYVVAPGTVLSKSAEPFKVFSAFRRSWQPMVEVESSARVEVSDIVAAPSESTTLVSELAAKVRPAYFAELDDDAAPHLPAHGEAAAHSALSNFCDHVATYGEQRNFPAIDGTSRLSAFLRFGVLHPRQVLRELRRRASESDVFVSEIAWREFYADVLFHHPDSARSELNRATQNLRVDRDRAAQKRFEIWARGETGFPLVDAGMRQLLQEGWMHNRVRMVTASFLVKHLHLDWRWGARWFMWRLVDGDLASNQHGWQWTAGTGTDAAPFHRIFNPTLQGERFDPSGAYVRRYVNELSHTPAPQCLLPGAGDGLLRPSHYAAPMIDLARERADALARFADAREANRSARG